MKFFTFLIFSFFIPNIYSQEPVIATEVMILDSVISQWADACFIEHKGDSFKDHRAFYSDDYFIQTTRIEMHSAKIESLRDQEKNGTFNGTAEELAESIHRLEQSIQSAQEALKTIVPIDHYEVNYWSNIQTRDGITVYYEFVISLDGNFKIISVKENSSVGKISPESKIAYQSSYTGEKIIEKD